MEFIAKLRKEGKLTVPQELRELLSLAEGDLLAVSLHKIDPAEPRTYHRPLIQLEPRPLIHRRQYYVDGEPVSRERFEEVRSALDERFAAMRKDFAKRFDDMNTKLDKWR